MRLAFIINVLKKKVNDHRKKKYFILPSIVHLIKYFFFNNYRNNRCLIDPQTHFFYKFHKKIKYFSFFLIFIAKYLQKKKIFISINNSCNYSPGHIYSEIDQIKRLQKLEDKYLDSTVWFTTSQKEILGETKEIFENKNFKILFGGIKRIVLTFAAIKYPYISINGSIGHTNYLLGKNFSHRQVFNNFPKKRSKLLSDSYNYYPNKKKLISYESKTNQLMKNLKINGKYIVVQIKTVKVNGTIKPLNPSLLLKSIKYFQDKDYQVIFAGREKFPENFLNKGIIDYANSRFTSTLNDFLLVGNCSLVISSASGFCSIAECFDKPLLITNAHHISHYSGRRTIYLPTLLSRKTKLFNAKIQHQYLCTYGPDCGYDTFKDMYILHISNSEEILMASKELEKMLSTQIPPLSTLQKKIYDKGGCPLLCENLSRISNNFLEKHHNFFYNDA